jgi:hypothetical protein
VELTRGKVALVDDDDFALVSAFKWSAMRVGRLWYATTGGGGGNRHPITLMHRVILGAERGLLIDHENHDGLDNRRLNLRFATVSQNAGNMRKYAKPTSSRFKGVYWDKHRRKWAAEICVQGKRLRLGRFCAEREAGEAYERAAREHFGQFACQTGGGE